MSVNSLANFGIPGLNGDRAAAIMPILTNHFRVSVFNFGATTEPAPYDITRQVKKVSLPKLTYETSTLYSYVSAVYIMTRAEWSEGTMTFMDDITNSVRSRIEDQGSKQQNFFDQTTSRAGENYKFEMDVDILAGGASAGGSASDPNILRKYCYAGCMLTNIEDGEMVYETAGPKEVTIGFRYDNCTIFNQNGARMGVYSHTQEIQTQTGSISTGAGAPGGLGISVSGISVSVNSGVALGGATVSGSFSSSNTFGTGF